MKTLLKEFIKRTAICHALRAIKEKRELAEWEKRGRVGAVPHIVKQRTIRDFAEKYDLKVLVETGTFYGDMVEAMKPYFDKIYSIELSNKLYEKAKQRFAGDKRIKIIHGDSGIELKNLMPILNQPVLFFLDGHYSAGVTARGDKDTPIYEELKHIFSSQQSKNVIIIDDARCFGTEPAYPSIEELSHFIRVNKTNVKVEIANDSIRIIPESLIC